MGLTPTPQPRTEPTTATNAASSTTSSEASGTGPLQQLRGPFLPHLLAGLSSGAALGIFAAFLGHVRASTLLLLLLALLGAAAATYAPTRRLWYGGLGLLACLVWLCLLTPVLRGPLQALEAHDQKAPADAIVVLGAGVNCGTQALDSTLEARLLYGLTLWRQQLAPIITLSEQSYLLSGPECIRMDVVQRRVIEQLLPVSDRPQLLQLANVTTTRDEAARVRDFADERGWKRILLVTSPSHSARAKRLFQAAMPQAEILSVPAPETRYDSTLPLPADRLFALRTLAYETLSRLKAMLGGTPER